jgi:hypothetical protein
MAEVFQKVCFLMVRGLSKLSRIPSVSREKNLKNC